MLVERERHRRGERNRVAAAARRELVAAAARRESCWWSGFAGDGDDGLELLETELRRESSRW